jgi:hypothetical protein
VNTESIRPNYSADTYVAISEEHAFEVCGPRKHFLDDVLPSDVEWIKVVRERGLALAFSSW